MSSRRMVCFLLGIWLGASFLMAWVVTNPPVNSRRLQRWGCSNRSLAAVSFCFCCWALKEGKFALGLVLWMLVGQAMPLAGAELQRGYLPWESAKWGAGLLLAIQLIRRRRGRSGDTREDFDMVDKSDHRHINR